MKARDTPDKGGDTQRLLAIDSASGEVFERTVGELPQLLRAGDLVVLNDAATMPASLQARAHGAAIELRLAGPPEQGRWLAVLFGDGSWRVDTDARPAPPRLELGARIDLDGRVQAHVVAVDPTSTRLVWLAFDVPEAAVWSLLYRRGQPVQYSYLARALALSDVQTSYAGRPWSVEMPSAGRPLTIATLLSLRRRGIEVEMLTHAAGLSATGDPALDARLPLPERYDLPVSTVVAVAAARARGGRVVAVGTSVVRALEGSAAQHGGVLQAGSGLTDLRISPSFTRRIVDGVLSGVHEPGSSHHALLGAFADASLLEHAHAWALAHDLQVHEFGDSTLVLPGLAHRDRLAA